ncbi:MAG: PIG-L family deacetylase [Deltaproteobacteria bacterium]|nr:PIG-L family deacetylase [Deltaproteobacteria bacterium]
MHFDPKTRILVVAAHPDDEILGCGGTLARAIRNGACVEVMFLSEGTSARFPLGEYDSQEYRTQAATRRKEAEEALKALGINEMSFCERLGCQFDTYPILSIVKDIENKMESYSPTMLFTHNPLEVNIDHRITYEAVEAACRPVHDWVPKEIYLFEVVCSGSWTFQSRFRPNVFVDISDVWEIKMKAWQCYKGEQKPYPFPRSQMGQETLARYRGISAGLEKAEAFCLVRKII